jgi:hypothetical protein
MGNIPAEIIKEYRVKVVGLDFPVCGRIVKSVSGDNEGAFLGELSHFCKKVEGAGDIHKPDLVSGSVGNVEYLIVSYLEDFTAIDVQVNASY